MTKIALITGATSGIGEATAELFAREGYNLILTGRRAERLDKLAAHLNKKHNIEVATSSFDVRSRDEVVENLEGLPAKWKARPCPRGVPKDHRARTGKRRCPS